MDVCVEREERERFYVISVSWYKPYIFPRKHRINARDLCEIEEKSVR